MAIFPEIEKFIYYNLFICKRKVRNRYILFFSRPSEIRFPGISFFKRPFRQPAF